MMTKIDPAKPIKNTRHEAFAQTLAKGLTEDTAYVNAGYKPDRGNAARLTANDSIQARVTYLQQIAAERAAVTVNDIVAQLDADRELARQKGHAGAMVQATMGKAKVLGLIVDRHLVGIKTIEEMNEQELYSLLGNR